MFFATPAGDIMHRELFPFSGRISPFAVVVFAGRVEFLWDGSVASLRNLYIAIEIESLEQKKSTGVVGPGIFNKINWGLLDKQFENNADC